jgi:hypothetical protein
MEIICHTNLDLYPNEHWPKELPCRPMVGDIITSSTGLELQVVRVVFKYTPSETLDEYSKYKTSVTCSVELHLPSNRFENLTAFETWYKKRRL